MRILLSTPPVHPHQSYSLRYRRFPLLNLALLAALVRERHEVRIVSHALRPWDDDALPKAARAFRPDAVAFSLPSAVSALGLRDGIRRLRAAAPGVRVVAGGPFPSYDPAFCLDLGADVVFLGEADAVFPRWADDPDGTASGPEPRDGLAWRAAGGGAIAGRRVIAEDLPALPLPAWDLLPYRPEIYTRRKAAAVEASRGCPYACAFCAVHDFGKGYRPRPVARVLEELSALKAAGFGELLFVDNSFAEREAGARELAEGMLRAGHGFEFGAYLRADAAVRGAETVRLLARAGLRYAIVGFESHGNRGLAALNKGSGAETNLGAARALRGAGVFVIGSHIFGAPGETPEDARRTYRVGVESSDLFKAGIFTPLPGSPLHDELRRAGRIGGSDPLAFDYVHASLGSPAERRRLQRLAAWLFLRYSLHPARLAKTLHPDPWTRRIFRAEYRGMAWRALLLLVGGARALRRRPAP